MAWHGLLVRGRRGIKEARNIDTIFFEKPDTLNPGAFRVVKITTDQGIGEDEVLALASAAEHDPEHMFEQEIVKSAVERDAIIPKAGFNLPPPAPSGRTRTTATEKCTCIRQRFLIS